MLQRLKQIAIILCVVVIPSGLHAQRSSDCYFRLYRHDIGITAGATYYMGDFNDQFIPLRQPSYFAGVMYRFHFDTQYSLRAQISYGRVLGDATRTSDAIIDPSGNNWAFNCPIIFADVMGEIGLAPLNVTDFRQKERFAPFLLVGVGAILRFKDNDYVSPLQNDKSNVTRQYFSIPIGVGVKYAIAPRYTLGVEWIMRKTFVDDMDNYNDPTPQGSALINNDWLSTVGLTLSYRIPERRTCAAYPVKKKRQGLVESSR